MDHKALAEMPKSSATATMKAARLEATHQLHVKQVAKPVPEADEVLVRVEASGVCGTDRHLFLGEFPCTPPVTLGHEFCGIVEDIGSSVQGIRVGMRVTGDPNIACGRCSQCHAGRVNLCLNLNAIGIHRDGGLAEYLCIPYRQAHALPLSLKPEHGAFCEPLACCLRGIDVADIKTGSSVVVLGGGVIGLLVVQLARLAGATRVVLSTRQESRRRLAEEIGATATIDPRAGDIVERLTGPGGLLPGGADVVIECAGVGETMEQSFLLARAGGSVVILGVMPQGSKITIEPFKLLFRELRVFGSFLNPFTHKRAADLIASGALQLDCLISRRVGLDEIPDVIAHPPAAGEVKVLFMP